jgi:hypothetical protein
MEQNGSINYTATRCSKSEEKLTCVGSAAIAAAKHNPLVSFECSTFARWRCVEVLARSRDVFPCVSILFGLLHRGLPV